MGAMREEAESQGQERYRFFADPHQLDMLRNEKGQLPRDALQTARRHGPGRPLNSRNKRNKDVARYFIGKYGDPLDALGEIMTMPLDVLREQLVLAQGGEASKSHPVRAVDVMNIKMNAIVDALPYIHGKQAIAVNVNKRTDAIILIPGLNAPGDIALDDLQAAIDRHGLEAFDPDSLRLLPDGIEDADFSEAQGGADDE